MANNIYVSYNETIKLVDSVFATLVVNTPEEEYMKHVNHASFVISSPQITMDLQVIAAVGPDDLEGFVEQYLLNFKTAYKQSFMSASGFGEATAERYASQATGSMLEVIDTYLAMR